MAATETGDLLLFVDEKHPPAPTHLYRSRDHGRSWEQQADTVIHPLHRKPTGMVPSMHMDERGITLRHGPHLGRLLRTASNYMGGNIRGGPADAFCNAIYSDDGGLTWPVKRRIEPGAFAYSSLAAGRNGTPSAGWIYLQYESGPKSMIARFNLAWRLQGETSGDGTIPDWVR